MDMNSRSDSHKENNTYGLKPMPQSGHHLPRSEQDLSFGKQRNAENVGEIFPQRPRQKATATSRLDTSKGRPCLAHRRMQMNRYLASAHDLRQMVLVTDIGTFLAASSWMSRLIRKIEYWPEMIEDARRYRNGERLTHWAYPRSRSKRHSQRSWISSFLTFRLSM